MTNKIYLYKYQILMKILGFLYEKKSSNVNSISKGLDIINSNVSTYLSILQKNKFVKSTKSGRESIYQLTDKGKEIGKNIIPILEVELI